MKRLSLIVTVLLCGTILAQPQNVTSRVWTAKWIGPAAETRPDEDFGEAQWITASASTNGTVTLASSFVVEAVPDDAAVELVHAGRPDYELAINGRRCYLWKGHVRDTRRPVFRDVRQWLKPGRNEISVVLSGGTDASFIAKLTFDGKTLLQTSADWRSSEGTVRTLGKMREPTWGKEMILRTETVSPAFARRFAVKGPLASARLRVTGVGFYEAWLNGGKVGDKVLDPSPTAFDKRILYSTYDLKPMLQLGENELVLLLGHGWYDVHSVATWNFEAAPWRDFPRALAQLDLTYADGSVETVGTDGTWRQIANPVLYDDIYEGEVIDGRIGIGTPLKGRSLKAVEVSGPKGRLVPEEQPGARIVSTVSAKAVHALPDGAYMIEFPENVSGWLRLPLFGQKSGDVVSFRYDERVQDDFSPADASARDGLHDDGLWTTNVTRLIDTFLQCPASHRVCANDAAMQCDRYFCRGEDGEIYEPRFTTKGFRFVLVRGLARAPRKGDAVACFVRTDFAKIGSFTCSDPIFTQLVKMGERAYESNFTDGVPTDCPHREKNGWTGDAAIASELAQYVYENTAGYEKWLRDVMDAQRPSGELCAIAPTSGWGYQWGNGPGWDSALPVIAWNLWCYRDDRKIIDEVYPSLKRYLAYTATRADADGLVKHGLGDWVPVNRAHMPTTEYTSSCYYYQAQRIAAEMARVKGLAGDAETYGRSALLTREGIRARYRREKGVWDNGGQTAQAMALAFGLVEDAERPEVEARLVDSVIRTGYHADFGLFGSKHLFRALSRMGRTDLAWKVIMNPTAPSFAEWARKGGTTLWEEWGGGGSQNHIMFGDFVAWAYQHLAGIRLQEREGSVSAVTLPSAPAFRKAVIEPVFLSNLAHLDASVRLSQGTLGVSWQRTNGVLRVRCRIPEGVEAQVRLPGRKSELRTHDFETNLADPAEPWQAERTEVLKDELVRYARQHGHAAFADKIEAERNTTEWMAETLSYGTELLKSCEGRDFRDSERRTALEIIDYPLHVDNYDPRHTTVAETNAWEAAVADHFFAARERVLREARETKVPDGSLRLWRIYNMAYLAKGPRHTVLIDLSKRPNLDGLWAEKDFAAFAELADVFVLTHPHRDHCCPEILQAFLARKKPVVLPCDLKLNDPNAHVLDKDHFEPLEIGGIKVRNFVGHQGKGVPCNVYWLEIDGVRLADNGDNYVKEQERRLAKCPPVDGIIASTWNTVTNMVASCAAAKGFDRKRAVFLPSHENELGHSVAHREGYRRMYANPDRLAAPCFSWPRTLPLHWGESVIVTEGSR